MDLENDYEKENIDFAARTEENSDELSKLHSLQRSESRLKLFPKSRSSKYLINSGPLASVRDPRRSPVLGSMSFAPKSFDQPLKIHSQRKKNNRDSSAIKINGKADTGNKNDALNPATKIRRNVKKKAKNRKRKTKKDKIKASKSVIPAYAFKNATTGLLEISEMIPPTPSQVAIQNGNPIEGLQTETQHGNIASREKSKENSNINELKKTPALYPIALNGGALGVYTHPTEFGMNTSTYFTASKDSQGQFSETFNNNINLKTLNSRRGPLNSHIAFPSEIRDSGEGVLSGDKMVNNLGEKRVRSDKIDVVNSVDSNNLFDYPIPVEKDPWKHWEKVHMEMSKVANTEINQRKRRKYSLESSLDEEDQRSNQFEEDSNDELLSLSSHLHLNPHKLRTGRISSVYNQDDFDFAIVLQPQQVYKYWAKHLDFRDEHYEDEPLLVSESDDLTPPQNTYNVAEDNSKMKNKETPNIAENERKRKDIYDKWEQRVIEVQKSIRKGHSPLRSRINGDIIDENNTNEGKDTLVTHEENIIHTPTDAYKTPTRGTLQKISTSVRTLVTAKKTGVDTNGRRVFSQRKSLFERAMGVLTPPRTGTMTRTFSGRFSLTPRQHQDLQPPSSLEAKNNSRSEGEKKRNSTYSSARRRWGNSAVTTITSPNQHPLVSPQIGEKNIRSTQTPPRPKSPVRRTLMSPPINSISETGVSFRRNTKTTQSKAVFLGSTSTPTKNTLSRDMDDSQSVGDHYIPSQAIPRGIAARTNGMQSFLQALHRGIVVRRHIEGGEAEFITLKSKDGGDTITFQYIPLAEARIALLEQRVRFNRNKNYMSKTSNYDQEDRWNLMEHPNQHDNSDGSIYSNIPDSTNLPNHIIVQNQLKMTSSNIFSDYSVKLKHSGKVHAKDVIAVHPGRQEDPFEGSKRSDDSEPECFGTWTFRKSKTKYCKDCSFSLILPQTKIRNAVHGSVSTFKHGIKGNFNHDEHDSIEKWHFGKGSTSTFRTLDLETATEGEYWIIFRGFLLLHRDAVSGRFAAQRASGFSSHYNRKEDEERRHAQNRKKDWKVSEENEYVHHWQRLWRKWKGEPEIEKPVLAPPSDYFLGFRSAGTQIWCRLRQAGLETQRIYALDTRRVMIKVRCPPERLHDVAEVLKIKLRTTDGNFLPFQESIVSQFITSNEFNEIQHVSSETENLFRSSDRQKIIDFMIRSRIRDSGAELGERSHLGKQIEMRVPLHMHAKLELLYRSWVTYWQTPNWIGRDGKSMVVGFDRQTLEPISENHTILMGDSHTQNPTSTIVDSVIPSLFSRFIIGSFYQPLDSVQEYFGEGVAFYFAWLQHCSYHLVSLSVVGVIVSILQIVDGQWDHPIRPFFSFAVMLWGLFVMMTWRRRSNFLAHKWGTLNYEEEETTRPQFKGEYRKCDISKEWIIYYPSYKRWLKYCLSFPLTIAFTVLSTIGILMVHANRDILLARYFETQEMSHASLMDEVSTFDLDLSIQSIGKKHPLSAVNLTGDVIRDPIFWEIVVGFPSVLGFCYPLLNYVLMKISIILNDFENHRTESEYRNNLVLKVFSFRFACYFSSLYYYSFLLPDDTELAKENSIFRVATSLIVYLTVVHWWNVFVVIYVPLTLHRWKLQRERNKLRHELRSLDRTRSESKALKKNKEDVVSENNSQFEASKDSKDLNGDNEKKIANRRVLLEQAQDNVWEEIMLPQYDSFYDYVLAAIQFGYVTCFSVVLPFTPLICLVNNLMSMRLDAYKLCRGRRRPLVTKASGIGVWEHVLHIVTVISILTNCSLMALTSNLGSIIKQNIGDVGLFFVVVGWEHFMLLIKYIIQAAVSQMPQSVRNDQKRLKYLNAKKNRSAMQEKKGRRSELSAQTINNDNIRPKFKSSQINDLESGPLENNLSNPPESLRRRNIPRPSSKNSNTKSSQIKSTMSSLTKTQPLGRNSLNQNKSNSTILVQNYKNPSEKIDTIPEAKSSKQNITSNNVGTFRESVGSTKPSKKKQITPPLHIGGVKEMVNRFNTETVQRRKHLSPLRSWKRAKNKIKNENNTEPTSPKRVIKSSNKAKAKTPLRSLRIKGSTKSMKRKGKENKALPLTPKRPDRNNDSLEPSAPPFPLFDNDTSTHLVKALPRRSNNEAETPFFTPMQQKLDFDSISVNKNTSSSSDLPYTSQFLGNYSSNNRESSGTLMLSEFSLSTDDCTKDNKQRKSSEQLSEISSFKSSLFGEKVFENADSNDDHIADFNMYPESKVKKMIKLLGYDKDNNSARKEGDILDNEYDLEKGVTHSK